MGHIGPARKRYEVLAAPATAVDAPATTRAATPTPTPGDASVPAAGPAVDPEPAPRGGDERRGR